MKNYEYEAHYKEWGIIHANDTMSLVPLVGTADEARLIMDVISVKLGRWNWKGLNITYARQVYELLQEWDEWTPNEGVLCKNLLKDLINMVEVVLRQHGKEHPLIEAHYLLRVLRHAVNNQTIQLWRADHGVEPVGVGVAGGY